MGENMPAKFAIIHNLDTLCAGCNKPLEDGENYASMGGNIEPYIPANLYHLQCIPTLKPEREEKEPYFVEVDNNGCTKCGVGRTWVVVGPDGCAGGTSYGLEEDAADLAEDLNIAFFRGQSGKLSI